MASKPDCIFCKIVRGEAPAHRVCEDERTLAFMDIFPVTDGHTLVITKDHFENVFEADEDALAAIARTSHRVAAAIRSALAPDGLMVFQLNGQAAGQTVFHYHMHLMPRASGEPLALHTRVPGVPARLAELAAKLARALALVLALAHSRASRRRRSARSARSGGASGTRASRRRRATGRTRARRSPSSRGRIRSSRAVPRTPSRPSARRGATGSRIGSTQCREWTAWQLRNFNQHERTEGTAPSVLID